MSWRAIGVTLVIFVTSSARAQAPANKEQQQVAPELQLPQSQGERQQRTTMAAAMSTQDRTESAEKKRAVKKLLKLMGAANLSDQMMEVLTPQLNATVASAIPQDDRQKFMDSFAKKLRGRLSADDIVDVVASIYASHFSLEEIQDLSRFYESPVGQRLVAALPQIAIESQAAGVRIGQKAVLQALRDMSVDYPDLKKLLPPDEVISNGAGGAVRGTNPK